MPLPGSIVFSCSGTKCFFPRCSWSVTILKVNFASTKKKPTYFSPSYSRSSSLIWESICGALDRISLFLPINYIRWPSWSESRKSKIHRRKMCSVYRKQTCMKHNTDAKISFWLNFVLFFCFVHIFLSGLLVAQCSPYFFCLPFDRCWTGWNGQVNRFSFRWKSLYRITEWIDDFFILRKWTKTTSDQVVVYIYVYVQRIVFFSSSYSMLIICIHCSVLDHL